MLYLLVKDTFFNTSDAEGFKDFFGDGVILDYGELIFKIKFILYLV